MSWEISEHETTCYCGKGKIILTIETDDWNRMKTHERIGHSQH